jgi:hypothetical protein
MREFTDLQGEMALGYQEPDVPWNETLLFCTGLLLIGLGVQDANTAFSLLLQGEFDLELAVRGNSLVPELIFGLLLTGTGVVLAARFPQFNRWMARRSRGGSRQL